MTRKFRSHQTRKQANPKSIVFLSQGALNPEAESAVTERFQVVKARLRDELHDQLQNRTEQLDEERSALEYTRNKAEISALEAKVCINQESVAELYQLKPVVKPR